VVFSSPPIISTAARLAEEEHIITKPSIPMMATCDIFLYFT
jgi:hypothetical protein